MKTEVDARQRLKLAARKRLPFLLEFGNEDDITAYARVVNPRITEEGLRRVIRLFRDAQRARAHSRQSH
jgi:hypothetical protein